MVLLVRMDLEMGKGKMAAQCAHAAIGAYEEATQRRDRFLKPWQKYGQTKIALKVPDEATLVSLAQQAQHSGLNTYVVRDAGRTQIAAGSLTVAAIGPGPVEAVDKITGHLKLL
jgi:peptidyl-tRNA hydrolase, PTH2 family